MDMFYYESKPLFDADHQYARYASVIARYAVFKSEACAAAYHTASITHHCSRVDYSER